jgi:hypothetical protein
MTQKRKPKISNTLIDKFFNNILFVQRYTFQTPVTMYTVMVRLHELSDEKHGWLNRKSRYIVESEDLYDHYEFDIRAKDRRHQYTISHTTGTVHSTDNEDIRIEGEIRFGVAYFFRLMLSLLWMFFIFQFFNLRLSTWMLWFIMITPMFSFVHMFRQRNQLIKKIQSAITPRLGDDLISEQKQRKGLGEIYAELNLSPEFMPDESPETLDYDQQ